MPNDQCGQDVGVVGANGFIGSAILRYLLEKGISPRALCGPGIPIREPATNIEYLTCDLNDSARLQLWINGLEVVIHSAGPPSVRQSFEIPEEYVRAHVQGTLSLLQACRRAKVRRIIYLSSAEVYGRPERNPVSETHRTQARSPYAAAKIAAEKMIEAYAESYAFHAIVLRPFSVYGPNPTPESLFGTILSMIKTGCIRLQDLRPIRDYCNVEDLARAVWQALSLRSERLRTINIGTGRGTSVAEFARYVLRTLDIDIPVVEERSHSRREESQIFELVADTSVARELLGWRAEIELQEGLRRALGAKSISK